MHDDYCAACGRPRRSADRFCRGCGEPLDDVARTLGPIDEAEGLLARGHLDEAVVTLQRALGAHETAELHVALSTVYVRRGSVADAHRELERAVALDPHCAIAHAYAGALFMRAGRPDEARERLDLARELAPNDMVVSLKRAEMWLMLGVLGNAGAELEHGLLYGGGSEATRAAARKLLAEVEKRMSRSVTRKTVRLPGAGLMAMLRRRPAAMPSVEAKVEV
jgi:Flp pilus assembly protein TadD